MTLAFSALGFGLLLLMWSADRFVDGAVVTARRLGMRPLLVGLVIVGVGTSAPELAVSALASWQGNAGLALGNAYGSNIANLALILGLAAMVGPITVHSAIVRHQLPILTGASLLAAWLLLDGTLSRLDAALLLGGYGLVLGWNIRTGLSARRDALEAEAREVYDPRGVSLARAIVGLVTGLVLLVASSRLLVWGAEAIAQGFGISDVIIGLTIVAVGTSLPELASTLAAARRDEDDIALGNVIGSNLFNTLVAVGLSGAIRPGPVPAGLLARDVLLASVLTLALYPLAFAAGRPLRIGRLAGALLFAIYVGYTLYLIAGTTWAAGAGEAPGVSPALAGGRE